MIASNREDVLASIVASGVMAILRLEQGGDLAAVEAIGAGGATAVEIVFTPTSLAVLSQAQRRPGRGMFLGAGSIFTPEAAGEAIRAGAAFVATPTVNPDIVRMCREMRVPCIPSGATPTEIRRAWDLGTGLVTLFPAGPLGAGYLREVLETVPEGRVVATGGIGAEHVGDFIRAGAAAVGMGDAVFSKDVLARRDLAEITRRTRMILAEVQDARGRATRPVQPIRPVEGPDVR